MPALHRRRFLKTAGLLAGASVIAARRASSQTPEPLRDGSGNEARDGDRGPTEFHVAADGNDSNPGTAAAPLRTI